MNEIFINVSNLLAGFKSTTNRGHLINKDLFNKLKLHLIIFTINIHYKITLITLKYYIQK